MFVVENLEPIVSNEAMLTNTLAAANNQELDDAAFVKGLDEPTKALMLQHLNAKGFGNAAIIGQDGQAMGDFKTFRTSFIDSVNMYKTIAAISTEGVTGLTLEGKDYNLNDKGELVDETNKVIKSAFEVKKLMYDSDPDAYGKGAVAGADKNTDIASIIKSVGELSGFTATDEKGNPVEFEATTEGLAKREAYIVKQYGTQLANQALENMFNDIPDLEDFIDYVKEHKTAAGFTPVENFTNVTLDKNNKDQLIDVMTKANIARGMSAERAKQVAQWTAEDGKGFDSAKEDLEYLKGLRSAKADARKAAQLAAEEANRIARQRNLDYINDTVKSGKIGDVTIPEFIRVKNADGTIKSVSRDNLLAFMLTPNDKGITPLQERLGALTPEQRLNRSIMEAYMLFTGNDMNDLVKAATGTQRVVVIKNAKQNNNGSGAPRSSQSDVKVRGVNDVKL